MDLNTLARTRAEVERMRAENESLKMWRDNDPYYKAGKRAAEIAIAAWEIDCVAKNAASRGEDGK